MALDEKPTDLDFAHYSKVINTWELLAPYLKITNPESVALKRDSYDYNEQKLQMLFMWRRKNGSRATRRVLAEACRNADEIALAEKIEGKPQPKVAVSKPVLATPIQATPTDLSSSSAPPTHLSYEEPIEAQDIFPEVQRRPEASNRVQSDFSDPQNLSAASSLASATNQPSISPGGPPDSSIGSSVNSSIGQSITATVVDLPDNELITGTSSALHSLPNISNTEVKGLSTTSASTTISSSHHSMSSTRSVTSRDNPSSTSSLGPSPVTFKDLKATFKKYFSKIADTIKLDSITFATQLMSASIIDSSIVQKITFTQGWTPPQQANTVLFSVETGLNNSKDPVTFFIEFCSILQDYVNAKEIAIGMMHDANLSFPEVPPLVVQHNTTPTVTIPPTTHTHRTHGTAMEGASTSTSTVAETPSCDFSQYHDVNRYGQPTMIELLNWIVAVDPSIWNEVGVQLGISEGDLKAVQMNISFAANPKLLFKEVLSLWERSRSTHYTWGTILNALASPFVGQVGLAQGVARKLDSK